MLGHTFASDAPEKLSFLDRFLALGVFAAVAAGMLIWNQLTKGDNQYVAGLVTFAAVIGPLVEVPVQIALVPLALRWRTKFTVQEKVAL